MPPPKGSLWQFFYEGSKQNSAHVRAHCIGCLEQVRPAGSSMELDENGIPKLSSESWVFEACGQDVGGVIGKKDSMAAHILGKGRVNPCPHASEAAKKTARSVACAKKREREPDDSGNRVVEKKKAKRDIHTKIETKLNQSKLKVFRGIQVLFTSEQVETVRKQFFRATIAANLPFQWVENPEVIALFMMFRATASSVIPSRQQIAGELLDKADADVKRSVMEAVIGKYAVLSSDGWKDESRNSINGVNISVGGKTYLIHLINATSHKKDGDSMCSAFQDMIDRAEAEYGVVVVAFCYDNDGGSQRGRKNLVMNRPWLFGPPCWAHQFQLILGDYFVMSEEAAATAEEATDLIGWLLNHGKVRCIFNAVQTEVSGKVLAFLVANMTRWATHFIAFDRLFNLQDSMHRAVISQKNNIIAAQVGAEKNRQKEANLRADAEAHCDLIDDKSFWRRLKSIIDDLEPICLGLNLNQMDAMRPDSALLMFAGIFIHFKNHSNQSVANGMTAKIEKRWKALDQPMFVLALVLNPYEGLSRFGDDASVSPFTLQAILVETYQRVCSWPSNGPDSDSPEVKQKKEKDISKAFLAYLTGKGPFQDWEKNKEIHRELHGNDPIPVWEALAMTSSVAGLADFAILLLGMSVNQAGLERNFSDLKIKKTRLRNRLTLPRLEKMAKVGAEIRAEHQDEGLVSERKKRTYHDKDDVSKLLTVPRYADLIEEGIDSESVGTNDSQQSNHQVGLVKSRAGWRKEMVKWVHEEQERDDDDDENELADRLYGRKRSKWLPRSLNLLFGGRKESDISEQVRQTRRQKEYSEEALMMELLASEEMDEERIPDDGELEGSDSDFIG